MLGINVRLRVDVHQRLTEEKDRGDAALNTQVMRAVRDYHTLAEQHLTLPCEYETSQAQVAAVQVAQQQTESQVAALMQLHTETVGAQFTQLAEVLTAADRSATQETALLTAPAVQHELRRPGAKQQQRTAGGSGHRRGRGSHGD